MITKRLVKTPYLSDEEAVVVDSWLRYHFEIIDRLFDIVWILLEPHSLVFELHLIPSIALALYHEMEIMCESRNTNRIMIIRFLFDCFIDSEIFVLPDVKRKIIKEIVETSLQLLETNVPKMIEKEKKCCFSLERIFRL